MKCLERFTILYRGKQIRRHRLWERYKNNLSNNVTMHEQHCRERLEDKYSHNLGTCGFGKRFLSRKLINSFHWHRIKYLGQLLNITPFITCGQLKLFLERLMLFSEITINNEKDNIQYKLIQRQKLIKYFKLILINFDSGIMPLIIQN
ncbi:hypothetical protein pb186bvf_017320 [Paramecium bursaria]